MQLMRYQAILLYVAAITLFVHGLSVSRYEQSKQHANDTGRLMLWSKWMCDCGLRAISCSFENGMKKCSCENGYADNNGKCDFCNCGPDTCSYKFGVGRCNCKKGFKETNWSCKECDCGPKGTCGFNFDGKSYTKKCSCQQGFVSKDGKCSECVCDHNETCSFEIGRKKCSCERPFSYKKGICTECDCGPNGTCVFEDNEKKCSCNQGFGIKNGKCTECDCGTAGTCSFDDNGTKICRCDSFFEPKDGICTECFCGHEGTCFFENGEKKCSCDQGFREKDGKCIESCSEDDDCDYRQKCKESWLGDGWKTCQCADGLAGKHCEREVWCKDTGKFKNCRGENGTCEYIPHRRTIDCICPIGKSLHPYENRCIERCDDGDCGHGSECSSLGKFKFCKCSKGLSGDKCSRINDCEINGKYRNCNAERGRCEYDEDKKDAICTCDDKKEFDPALNFCLDCDCGENGNCSIHNGVKKCYCDRNFVLKDGKCEGLCDPNPCRNGICIMAKDYKIYCNCNEGFVGPFCEERIVSSVTMLLIGIVAFFGLLILLLCGTLGYIYLNGKRM